MRFGHVGFEGDSLPRRSDGLRQLALCTQRYAEIVEIGGIRRALCDGLANYLDRRITATGLQGNDTEHVERVGVAGLYGQHAAVTRLGLRQTPFLVVPRGNAEEIRDLSVAHGRPVSAIRVHGNALMGVPGPCTNAATWCGRRLPPCGQRRTRRTAARPPCVAATFGADPQAARDRRPKRWRSPHTLLSNPRRDRSTPPGSASLRQPFRHGDRHATSPPARPSTRPRRWWWCRYRETDRARCRRGHGARGAPAPAASPRVLFDPRQRRVRRDGPDRSRGSPLRRTACL